jgi:hypothetical protein
MQQPLPCASTFAGTPGPFARDNATHSIQTPLHTMKKSLVSILLTGCLAITAIGATSQARAQSELSALSAISALPVASVVVGGSAVAGSAVAVPLVLSATGTVLVVKAVEPTVRGTVYVLERASDGARVSVEVLARAAAGASIAVGTVLTSSVIVAGVVLSVAGSALAFIPNELGRALLHNERLTY